ncbi:perilipin-3-like [Sarcophilus harrisii]
MKELSLGSPASKEPSASNEPIEQERMSRPQVPEQEKSHLSMDNVQPLKETNSNDDMSKEASTSLSEIQEEKLEVHVDKFFPIPPDVVNKEPSEADCYFREYFSRKRSNLQPQDTMKNMRRIKNNIRGLLYQLYETIELTCRRKQTFENVQNYRKALFELWIEWSKKQLENEDEDDIEFLEHVTLDMSRSISLKLQSAFMDLMHKVQGLPSSLQDDIQQACSDMQDLHTIFSLSHGFEDLDKHRLAQSQVKLIQAQGNVEKLLLYYFLEGF